MFSAKLVSDTQRERKRMKHEREKTVVKFKKGKRRRRRILATGGVCSSTRQKKDIKMTTPTILACFYCFIQVKFSF